LYNSFPICGQTRSSDEVKGLQSMVDEIHAAGLLAGISTHKNSTIEFCEKKYNIDVYLYP